jgi:hypothetical protein
MDNTYKKNDRRFDRIETTVKVKLKGGTVWTECADANISGCGLLFDAEKRLSVGDFDALQFMLQSRSGTTANVLFFATAKVVRTTPRKGFFRTGVELIIDDMVRDEIVRVLNIIKCQTLRVNCTTTHEAMFGKSESGLLSG